MSIQQRRSFTPPQTFPSRGKTGTYAAPASVTVENGLVTNIEAGAATPAASGGTSGGGGSTPVPPATFTPMFSVPLTGTVDGINKSFALPFAPTFGFTVYMDGQRLLAGYDYTVSGLGVTITPGAAYSAPEQWIIADIF